MNRLRVFALSAFALFGLSAASAQAAGWHHTYYRPVCRPPVVACAPAPCAIVAPAPVVCPPPVCAPSYTAAYYHQARFCERPIVYLRGCR
jgi:hypothetical protein